ncbi:MAG: hypothetical protein Q7S53_05580 [bacterium]|nr:hypothetical protein [bacterium]
MNKKLKIALFITIPIIILILIGLSVWFFWPKNKVTVEGVPEDVVKTKLQFTHDIFDPTKVKFVTPLGELNGGYEEAQTINGVCVNNKTAEEVEVYAPADMTLEDYSYFVDPRQTRKANWHLGFRISKDVKLSFDHITSPIDSIRDATPPTPTSGYVPPKKKLNFKAGELIAKTSGTDQAHNWNIYLRDTFTSNTFVNQDRYEALKDRYDYINATCPFDYYADAKKQLFIALMGATAPGQSKTCGNPSKDVKGAISGMWHLTRDGVQADYQGEYATPLSIYKDSAGKIVLYEINKKRSLLDSTNPTYKDPATITTSHCYALTDYGEGEKPKGYAYFKVVSDMEMKLAYSGTGSCPTTFPEATAKTYYR